MTLLATKDAAENSFQVAEAKYKCFESMMDFESEWYIVFVNNYEPECYFCRPTSVYYVLQTQNVATGYANNKIDKEAVKIDT